MARCSICRHAEDFGSWPTDHRGTHCRVCHRSWASLKESHCMVCHQHFSADSVADLHEPFCTSDTAATAEAMQNSVRKNGTPIFDTRDRQHGSVWIRWSPDTSTSHREHARSGLSVSPVPANGAEYRPHLGRVGADRPDASAPPPKGSDLEAADA